MPFPHMDFNSTNATSMQLQPAFNRLVIIEFIFCQVQ